MRADLGEDATCRRGDAFIKHLSGMEDQGVARVVTLHGAHIGGRGPMK